MDRATYLSPGRTRTVDDIVAVVALYDADVSSLAPLIGGSVLSRRCCQVADAT